ncbi:hypothetical protein CHH62_13140 [Niallia circulans]|uniref:hypothetical protein n=1 Tax=Niallia circulans TaxID=1397 RepID=UPI000BA568BB|nr:hypothetical protein [Niallia circulans]PAD25228.1 hypothetical protein CHH62_13140 [Niallia circulans]
MVLGEIADKKALALENLEVASDKLDPYIKSIREAIPKVGDNEEHFQIDLKRKRWKKGYTIFKEWFSWRAIAYALPVGVIVWFFKLNVILGFSFLSATFFVIICLLIYYILGVKALFDMTDESKEEFFHFRAYANYRREYEIFAQYLINGNVFRFKQALELMKEWDKDNEKKDDMILNLQKDLKKMANDSVRLPAEAEQEIEFVNGLSEKMLDKIKRKTEGTLTFNAMDLAGRYAIYHLEEDKLILEYPSTGNNNIPKTVDLDEEEMKSRSFVKILKSDYAWEADNKSTISFVNELNEEIYVYTVIVNERNRHTLNPQTSSGKINIDRLAEIVSTAFKLIGYNTSKKKRG